MALKVTLTPETVRKILPAGSRSPYYYIVIFQSPRTYMDDLISITERFINTTSSHIFLTGKAGTGKTTFLKSLSTRTHKTFIVVAPTGIAALNAGGVTIHSQFLLPPLNFIPERGQVTEEANFINQDILARQHPINSARKQVLRAIDLLVIDEVSMLRADLLDAIDYRMKAARGNFRQSFGGVQVLFIGDLYQLPPVVKNESWNLLSKYYPSPWFFEAHALRRERLVYIELQEIFRQKDQKFIDILNHLRNNVMTQEDLAALNRQFAPPEAIRNLREVITLTTHNYKADELNQRELALLPGPSHYFDAVVEGDFPESMYPVIQRIELRVGAQIMFIRNDTDAESKEYFNGKLATVQDIREGQVWVAMAERNEPYQLKRERWENKRYKLDESNDFGMESEVLGTFEQFPVKLAWAITVHKSQGLSFDKAIIDVGQAFADGQVYVALSRLRSLDGLILRTRINPSAISTDRQVMSFAEIHHRPEELEEEMKARQQLFVARLIERSFEFSSITKELHHAEKGAGGSVPEEGRNSILSQIAAALEAEAANCSKFRGQLMGLLNTDHGALLDRIRKGREYYRNLLTEQLKVLLHHRELTAKLKRVKSYLARLSDVDQLMEKQIEELDKVAVLTEAILGGGSAPGMEELARKRKEERAAWLVEIRQVTDTASPATSAKRKGKKKNKGRNTVETTLALLKNGLSVVQIATERGLARSTIESHLARAVAEGVVDILSIMTQDEVDVVASAIDQIGKDATAKDVFVRLKGEIGYGPIHAVMGHLKVHAIKSGG